jgi:hypothetical protein
VSCDTPAILPDFPIRHGKEIKMPLTKDFRDTVRARVDRDPEFRAALFSEAVQAIIDDDLPTARILLRDFTNGHNKENLVVAEYPANTLALDFDWGKPEGKEAW